MDVRELLTSLARTTRNWRERVLEAIQDAGCNDLSFRPKSGMSSLGWLLVHQAVAYDFTLNVLINNIPPKNPNLFFSYLGSPIDKGDWAGTSLQEIDEYYDSIEHDFLTWVKHVDDDELNRILGGPEIPQYFHGKRVIEALADTFAHLNHHNRHLSAIKGDWCRQQEE